MSLNPSSNVWPLASFLTAWSFHFFNPTPRTAPTSPQNLKTNKTEKKTISTFQCWSENQRWLFCACTPMFIDDTVYIHNGLQFSSVQFSCSVMSDSWRPHELQHTRPPCLLPAPGIYPNPCPLSRWCHPTISSSVLRVFSNESALRIRWPKYWSFSFSISWRIEAGFLGGWDSGILFCPASPHRVIKSPLKVSLVYPHLDLLALKAASGMTVAMNLL